MSHCIHFFPRMILAHAGDPVTGRAAFICVRCGLGALPEAPETWKPQGEEFPEGARFQFTAIGESDEPRGPSASPWHSIEHIDGVRLRDPVRRF